MNYDELAFFNRQLARMIQNGISLERGIQRLCANMKSGPFKAELALLHQDLVEGMPIVQALQRRKLPDYFQAMVRVGVESNNLAGVLILLADYYTQTGSIWMRLKGLMAYPAMVLLLALALSFWTAYLGRCMSQQMEGGGTNELLQAMADKTPPVAQFFSKNLWAPFFVIGFVTCGYGLLACFPKLRLRLEWAMPAFRDAKLAQFAAAMNLMISGGCSLPSALALAGQLEKSSLVGREIAVWQRRCAEGHGRWADIIAESQILPGLFRWLVSSPGEDLALGFKRASEIYSTRAAFQTEIMLYAAMPAALLFLGIMILVQLYPFVSLVFGLFKAMNFLI